MQAKPISSADDLIDLIGGNAPVQKRTGAHYQTVVSWRRRNRIPVDYWPALQALAAEKNVDVSSELLVALFSKNRSAAA